MPRRLAVLRRAAVEVGVRHREADQFGLALDAQLAMGYLPGMLWILAGVVFAGAVQDFMVPFFPMRRDGRSLCKLIKAELGEIPGMIALLGTFMIMLIILAVLALIVVKALTGSPCPLHREETIPIALFIGVYWRHLRIGRVGEISLIGFVLLMGAILGGQYAEYGKTLQSKIICALHRR